MEQSPEREEEQPGFIFKPRLKSKDFESAHAVADSYEPGVATTKQAELMAKFAGIRLTPEEVNMYSVLRETGPVPQMSDQEILAEVLYEAGDPEKLKKFTAFNANIFK